MGKSIFQLGEIKNLKITRKGMREMMRSQSMQNGLWMFARDIAGLLMVTNQGRYDATPIDEPVTSRVGAHAFVVTADDTAREEQAMYDSLNEALGG